VLGLGGLMALSRPGSALYRLHPLGFKPLHWPTFLLSYGRFLLGLAEYLGKPVRAPWLGVYDGLFWGIVLTLPLSCGRALVRRRRWGVLALWAGLAASLAAFHMMAGAIVLTSVFHRYGNVFIVPSVFALAALAREALFTAAEPGPARPRLLPVTFALALAAA